MSSQSPQKTAATTHLAILLMISWTLLVIISALWNIGNLKDQAILLAKAEARSNWDKDQSFRLWATRHGGLYVKTDDRTPPNPYLSHLPNRDVRTMDGQLLTLMNPAYMMRQMTQEFEERYGIKGKITGQVLLNPINRADEWELSALKKLENGGEEIVEETTIEGQPFVRLMRPMFMKEGCIKCHGHLGFKVGDMRGGVSVSVPLNKYLAVAQNHKSTLFATHGGIWALGILLIGFVSRRGKQREEERVLAEKALQASEERYRTLFEDSEVSIWHEDFSKVFIALEKLRQDGVKDLRQFLEKDLDVARELVRLAKVVQVNAATLRIFGADSEDQFLRHIDSTFGPDAIYVLTDALCAIWEKKTHFRSEFSFVRKDGRPLETILSFRIPKSEEAARDVPISVIDITDNKLAEETLQKSEERFRTLYHQLPMGVTIEDYSAVKPVIDQLKEAGINNLRTYFRRNPDKLKEIVDKIELRAVNESQLAIFGATSVAEYLDYDEAMDFLENPEWPDYYIGEISAFADGEITYSKGLKDNQIGGAPMELNCVSRLVKGSEGDWSEVITTHEEVSVRKQFEEQARRAQKMDAVGQLTGGIAHDFNNILGIVMGNLEIIEKLAGDDEKILGRVATAQRGTKRGAELTRKLLGFSRKEAHGKKLTSVNELIGHLDELLAKSLTVGITIGHHLDDDLWPVEVDPGDFQDAILNIALNARDAMPDAGTLVIETSNKVIDDKYVEHNPGSSAGEFVMLALTDSGAGMPSEVRERALEPFFTTKMEGRGSGLGLSMVYGFIQRSGGHMKIYSEPGDGTTVRLYLPRAHREEEKPVLAPDVVDMPKGEESILVVDDEEALADIAVTYLEDLGYKTYTANNGKMALKILKEKEDIDLLFTDVIMPGELDGYQLAIAAQKERPSLKVLLTSGFTKRKEATQSKDSAKYAELSSTLVSKPYTQGELARSIRNMLD